MGLRPRARSLAGNASTVASLRKAKAFSKSRGDALIGASKCAGTITSNSHRFATRSTHFWTCHMCRDLSSIRDVTHQYSTWPNLKQITHVCKSYPTFLMAIFELLRVKVWYVTRDTCVCMFVCVCVCVCVYVCVYMRVCVRQWGCSREKEFARVLVFTCATYIRTSYARTRILHALNLIYTNVFRYIYTTLALSLERTLSLTLSPSHTHTHLCRILRVYQSAHNRRDYQPTRQKFKIILSRQSYINFASFLLFPPFFCMSANEDNQSSLMYIEIYLHTYIDENMYAYIFTRTCHSEVHLTTPKAVGYIYEYAYIHTYMKMYIHV